MRMSRTSIGMNILKNSTLSVPDDVDFGTNPMCEAVISKEERECHEIPTEPSPRTIYSCWNQNQFVNWYAMHDRYVSEAKSFDLRKENDKKPVLMLIGDSI
eukprot:CAMPEP_0194387358 /NCGR_PEP_ID=MMETSP0174-20130528/91886_1 /TAXON_ID=216777 /ORGANISM="Proboscia alata, Strain PI-D3" /LENGTH=100 /DNA_ID=CAMNT_0039177467 /DNA_START=167 /DNA_END=466 /DNA_ORIENTATION=+